MDKNEEKIVEIIRGITFRTAVFNAAEIEALGEIMENYVAAPDRDYSLVTFNEGSMICGYIIYGKTPFTKDGWDLYWLAVDPECQGRGIGKKLIGLFEDKLLEASAGRAVVRVETSSRDEYAGARGLYLKCGYRLAGRIDNFYSQGDSLIIYSKEITG